MSSPTRPRTTRDGDTAAVLATWVRRCGLPFAILAWTGVALLLVWLAGQVIQTLLLLTLAAVLAYALAPAVTFLARLMPRFLAILVVYLIVLGAICVLLYLIVRTAIEQFVSLADYVGFLLTPSTSGQLTPLDQAMQSFGISPTQIASARDQIVASLEGFAGSIVPLLTGLVGVVLDVIVVAVLSIYLLADGARVSEWLRQNMPQRQQGRTVLGMLVSGALCVLLAVPQGWLIAVIVLVYFVVVHVIESDIVGPRIVGQSIGLHPVVSLAALIAGAELFGIGGALFASPVAGVIQALLVAMWLEWRATHPHQFQSAQDDSAETEASAADTSRDSEPTPTLLT